MVTAQCQADSHIEWDEDEERVWKHRLKHIEDLKANQTYERVQRQNVSQKILSHRWVDKPHRSRYTVRGYEQELTGSEDFYAPTPLSCLVKTLLVCAERDGHTVYFGDCTDAFLQSDLLEEIYVEPPAEAQEPADVVWRLHKALPGLKGGPVAWGTRIDGILGSPPLNFRRSRVDPCLWTNSEGVRIGRHMDDFIKTGPPVAVEAVTEYLERVAQLKVTGVLDKFGKQARFLGSFITKVHGGYTIQTDTETLLAGLRDLNLEHCKPSKLPGANPRTHDLTPLEPSEHKLYRRVVGRFLYCSAHRGDFAFSLNQLCRRVQSPTVSDMQALRKLARYIKGTLHYKLNIRPRHNTDLKIEAYTDADWAGQSDRHSITGGLLMLDGVNVSSWARTQKAIATSSGESELYAMSIGAAEALGLRELLTDIGLPTTVRLRCDSTAAMGTASRQGLGRMKHVQVRDLALQQWIADGRLTLQKIASSGNAADILTKHVSQNALQSLIPKLGLQQ